jgi:hypothetical protein
MTKREKKDGENVIKQIVSGKWQGDRSENKNYSDIV